MGLGMGLGLGLGLGRPERAECELRLDARRSSDGVQPRREQRLRIS